MDGAHGEGCKRLGGTMHHRPTKLAEQPIFERSIFRGSMNFYSLLSTMPWLNISDRINKISLTALYIDVY